MANRVMKDSGIDWIGDIPNKWEIKKGKYVFVERFSNGNNICLQLLSPTQKYGVIPQKLYEKYSTQRTVKIDNNKDLSSFKTIKKGDYCISLRSFQGGFEYSSYEGVVSPAYKVFYPKIEINRYYFKYLFKDKGFISKIASYSDSLRDGKSISFNEFGNTLLPIPPLKEQKLIANYLDNKCNEIDKLKEDITKQINILKEYKQSVITEAVTKGLNPNVPMKDSGIDWIGEIPQNWEVSKFKFNINIRTQFDFYNSEYNKYVGLENIISKSGKYIDTKTKYENGFYDSFKEGDILFSKLRPYLTKVWMASFNGVCSGEFLIIKDFIGEKKYLYYFLFISKFINKLNSFMYGTKMPRVSTDIINNLYITIPPLSEQQQIVDYLDIKCAEIDKIISSKEEQLNTLEEYKKSLIYEYVTGKKEVPQES